MPVGDSEKIFFPIGEDIDDIIAVRMKFNKLIKNNEKLIFYRMNIGV
jgi:hypothetical protein